LPDGRWQFDISRYPVVRKILRRATERHFRRRLGQYDERPYDEVGERVKFGWRLPPGVTEAMIPGNEAPAVVSCGQCGAEIYEDKAVYCEFEGLTSHAFCDKQCFSEWISENADLVADYLALDR